MNVLIKESQPLTAFGIHNLLEKEFKEVRVNMARSVEDILSLFYKETFDLFIIDTELSLEDTEQLIKEIHNVQQQSKILIYGHRNSKLNELYYIKMGASGYLSKRSSISRIVSAINLIKAGQVYISQDAFKNGNLQLNGSEVSFKKLSRRETEVFKLLVKGLSVNAISDTLNLKQTTISTLKRRIMKKMEVGNIAELVLLSTKLNFSTTNNMDKF